MARGDVSAAVGADESAYRVVGSAARNPAQGFTARFGRSGTVISSGSARFTVALRGVGRGRSVRAFAAGSPRVSANRVTYAWHGVREWWANGPLGLEQGFELARRPAGTCALTFSLVLSGRPRLARGGVLLPGGLRYGDVVVADATGRRLRAWLGLRAGRVLLRVDDRGARYPVRVDPIVQQAQLTASDGAAKEFFGYSVAVSAGTIVVGAPFHRVGSNTNQGVVYVFVRTASGWGNATESAELTASDGAVDDELGTSVAISGNTIVASGAHYRLFGSHSVQGLLYVFVRGSGGWTDSTQTAELTPSNSGSSGPVGGSVAMSGDTIVASSSQAVDVFQMPAGGWADMTPTAELTASTGTAEGGFDRSVSISGNTVVVGGSGGPNQSGGVYVFVRPAGGWANMTQTAVLTEAKGSALDELGYSVAISGDTIAAGGSYDETVGSPKPGAVYVFVKPAGGWVNMSQTAKLTGSDVTPSNTSNASDNLGDSVAVSGDMIAAGDDLHGGTSHDARGAVYVFVMPAGGWTNMTQTRELTLPDGRPADLLGYAVALSGDTIVAGSPGRTVGSNADQGAADVFALRGSIVPPCARASGRLAGRSVGPLRLGMTRAQADRAITRSADRHKRYEQFFCLTPIGIRVGYASPRLLRTVSPGVAKAITGRVVWISTDDPRYALLGVRAGASVRQAAKHLKLEPPFYIGRNDWYLAPIGSSTAVLKVRHRVVQEVGIADRQLTSGRTMQRTFLTSFF
jgi:hypothetical protein